MHNVEAHRTADSVAGRRSGGADCWALYPLVGSNCYWRACSDLLWSLPTRLPMNAITRPRGIEKKEPTNAIVETVISPLKLIPKRKHPPAGALAAHWQLGINTESANPMPKRSGHDNPTISAATVVLRTIRRPTSDITGAARPHRAASVLIDGLGAYTPQSPKPRCSKTSNRKCT